MPARFRYRVLMLVVIAVVAFGSVPVSQALFGPGPCEARNPNVSSEVYVDTPRGTGSYEPGDLLRSPIEACSGWSHCTGSIVADDPDTGVRYLLTAAHCVTDTDVVATETFFLDDELLGHPDEPNAEHIDIARIRLEDQRVAIGTLALAEDVVVDVARYLTTDQNRTGLVVCHAGLATLSYIDVDFSANATATAPTCGAVESANSNATQLCFKALATFGDSGATVFHIDAAGEVAVAGVLNNTVHDVTWFTGRIRSDRDALACYTPIDQALTITGLAIPSP